MSNQTIKCDVTNCKFNKNGERLCSLNCIKVTHNCSQCTCCGSFEDEI